MLHLVIANKAYSSWSLRPWILMTALGIPFKETVIPMYQPDSKARMLSFGPTGSVPPRRGSEHVPRYSLKLPSLRAD